MPGLLVFRRSRHAFIRKCANKIVDILGMSCFTREVAPAGTPS